MLKDKKKAIIFSLLAMLLWGSAIPLIKATYSQLNIGSDDTSLKILIAGIRFFIAGIITSIYYKLFSKKSSNSYKKINIKLVIELALIQITLQYIFYYIGLSNTSGVKSSIIQASNSFIIIILSYLLIPNDKISKKTIIALVVGTLGVIITSLGKNSDGSTLKLSGEGFILIATSFNALSSIIIRKRSINQDPFLLTLLQFFLGSTILIIIGLLTKKSSLAINPLAILMIIYGAFISATSFSIWTMIMQYHSANEFGIYKLFIPIFGSILSVILLGEAFTLKLAIGMSLVLIGSLILNLNKNK